MPFWLAEKECIQGSLFCLMKLILNSVYSWITVWNCIRNLVVFTWLWPLRMESFCFCFFSFLFSNKLQAYKCKWSLEFALTGLCHSRAKISGHVHTVGQIYVLPKSTVQIGWKHAQWAVSLFADLKVEEANLFTWNCQVVGMKQMQFSEICFAAEYRKLVWTGYSSHPF